MKRSWVKPTHEDSDEACPKKEASISPQKNSRASSPQGPHSRGSSMEASQSIDHEKKRKIMRDESSDGSSDEQEPKTAHERAFEAIIDQKCSTLILGPGGTGKSFLIEQLKERWIEDGTKFAVTATTGQAAIGIGGSTLHSFVGAGLGEEDVAALYQRYYAKNSRVVEKWRNLEVLVVDEISMLQPTYMEKIDGLARKARKKNEPFGGVQVVFLGDFFQLPPVQKNRSEKDIVFCFDHPLWPTYFKNVVFFDTIYRQTDKVFASILNRMRLAKMTNNDHEILKARVNAFVKDPTRLVPTLDQAKQINDQSLAEITEEAVGYSGSICTISKADQKKMLAPKKALMEAFNDKQKTTLDNLIKNSPNGDQPVMLKLGCQVLLTVNLCPARRLVNGSRGQVVGFTKDIVPLPIVDFGEGPETIKFHMWSVDDPIASAHLICYKQIPLKLAYALSIHKSQSMSLERARVDLNKIFAKGQVYVALSRVTTLEGLSLDVYNPQDVRADERVLQFEHSLRTNLKKGILATEALKRASATRS